LGISAISFGILVINLIYELVIPFLSFYIPIQYNPIVNISLALIISQRLRCMRFPQEKIAFASMFHCLEISEYVVSMIKYIPNAFQM